MRRTLLLHAQCGGWIGLALGVLDASVSSQHTGASFVLRIALTGGAVGGTLGALLGGLLGIVDVLAGRFSSRIVGKRVLAEPASGRAPASRTVSAFLASAVALAAFGYVVHVSERVQVTSLRLTVLLLGAAVSILFALKAAHWIWPAVARIAERLRRVLPLERLSSPALSFALFWAAPTVCVSASLIAIHGVELGSLRILSWAAIFAMLERVAFLSLRSRRLGLAPGIASGLILATTIAGGLLLLTPGSRELHGMARAQLLPDALSVLQRLTDVDRDGFSSLFGGRDCAPLDATRFPGSREIAGNGVDEDCDGVDATAPTSPVAVLPKFSSVPPLDDQPFNVLWYVVDSLRPDHLKMYGYGFETSPTLTALARESWVFERAYSQSSNTALSVPSMLSGRNPTAMRWVRGVFPNASSDEFQLPRAFSARGYLTGLAINSWVQERLPGIQIAFDRVLVSPPEVNWRSGDYLLSNLFNLVDEAAAARKPFFAMAHVDDVHHPYTASQGKAVPIFASPGEKARYDAGIALFDQGLRVVIEHLKFRKLWDRTVLIVNADHGEEFGEHGGTVHSRTCYSEVTHVPLLVRIPKAGARRISQPVALLDLAPTLLELLGARSPTVTLDGQSLFIPAYEPSVVDPERAIFCAIYQVMEGRPPLFIRSVRKGRWSFFEEAKTGHAELYDRNHDPGERVDVGESPGRESIVSELRQLLSWVQEGNLLRVIEGFE